ncbi:ABC transporter permease [Virgibacillus doumboii]|uniref:ABC transporter permease n=1 Tax=Virgibacillus doumboii TaxID=2697503 RepID=UPI0013E0CBB2|nr:ABC transporter permease [Virgibacillus doumboii]
MISLLIKQWMRNKERFLLSIVGVLLISGVLIYLFSLTESTKGTVNETLQKEWKSAYDLVVTPTDTEILNQNNLMKPNYLKGIIGGISYEKYETIKEITGVDVAAPLSVMGYTQLSLSIRDAFNVSNPGLYKLNIQKTHHNNLYKTTLLDVTYYTVAGWTGSRPNLNFGAYLLNAGFTLRNDQLIVGIDPKQEAKLVGLDDSIITSTNSRYLNENDTGKHHARFDNSFHLPVILNQNSFANSNYKVTLKKLDIPFKTETQQKQSAEKIREGNGKEFLNQIDTVPVDEYIITGKELEEMYFQTLQNPLKNSLKGIGISQLYYESSPLNYQKINSPFPKRWSSGFQVANQQLNIDGGFYSKEYLPPYVFRQPKPAAYKVRNGKPSFTVLEFNIIGKYDPNNLQVSMDPLTKLPLQTYRPAEATVVLDQNGEPLNPVKKIEGSGAPTALLPNPPNLLTTVKAAEKLLGGNSISSIRIKAKGIEEFGNASQSKLESIKQEIMDKTGLQVTITRGSSPQPTVTKIVNKGKAEGWMEQSWINIGAAIAIFRETSLGYTSVLLAVLLIGSMYVLATSYVSFLTNRKEYSILLALGWRTNKLRQMIVTEAVSYVLLITILAIGVEYILAQNGTSFSLAKVGLVGLTSFFIYGFGILIPLIQVGKLKPYQGIKTGEIHSKSKRIFKNQSITGLVTNQIMQRPGRNLLSILAIALPSTLLSFYIFVSFHLDGVLYTSYLGEFVAVEVNESHYFIMGAALLVAVLTTGEMLWQNIVERRNELALFKSIGWKNRTIGFSIMLEGALIGFLSGVMGLILSIAYIGLMYGIFPWDNLTILLLTICIPTVMGIIGAIIPTVKALRTNPYEVLKESA